MQQANVLRFVYVRAPLRSSAAAPTVTAEEEIVKEAVDALSSQSAGTGPSRAKAFNLLVRGRPDYLRRDPLLAKVLANRETLTSVEAIDSLLQGGSSELLKRAPAIWRAYLGLLLVPDSHQGDRDDALYLLRLIYRIESGGPMTWTDAELRRIEIQLPAPLVEAMAQPAPNSMAQQPSLSQQSRAAPGGAKSGSAAADRLRFLAAVRSELQTLIRARLQNLQAATNATQAAFRTQLGEALARAGLDLGGATPPSAQRLEVELRAFLQQTAMRGQTDSAKATIAPASKMSAEETRAYQSLGRFLQGEGIDAAAVSPMEALDLVDTASAAAHRRAMRAAGWRSDR